MKQISFLCGIFLAFYLPGFCQQFDVSPAKMYFELEPGQSQTKQITLRNRANKPQGFIISLQDWSIDELGNTTYSNPGATQRSCADWITISRTYLVINPNETQYVDVTMLVPQNESSTKWTMVFIQPAQEKSEISSTDKTLSMGLNLASRIGVQVYQSPYSNKDYKLDINNLRETTQTNSTRRYFSADIINTGDKIGKCTVYFRLLNLQTAEETIITPEPFNLLPGSSKVLTVTLPEDLARGTYSLAAILDYGEMFDLQGVELEIKVN